MNNIDANQIATRPDWLTKEMFPFESQFMEIRGHQVHFVDEGQGPTILFIHGNPTWSFLYRHLIKGLSGQYRCVAMDFPGFGLSSADADYGYTPPEHTAVLSEFVRSLNLTDAIILFHDWGGPIGLSAVEEMPDRFRGMIIGNTWA